MKNKNHQTRTHLVYICVHLHFPLLPFCNKGESVLLPSEQRSSWSWSFYGLWVPSSLTCSRFYSSSYLLSLLNNQSFPFLWDYSPAHKYGWLSFILKSLSLVPSSHSNYYPFFYIPSQLNVSKELFAYFSPLFHLWLLFRTLKLHFFPYQFTKTSHVKVTSNFHVVKNNGQFVFLCYSVSQLH